MLSTLIMLNISEMTATKELLGFCYSSQFVNSRLLARFHLQMYGDMVVPKEWSGNLITTLIQSVSRGENVSSNKK